MKVRLISFTSKYEFSALHWVDIQGVEGEDKGEGSQKRKTRPSFTVFFRPLRVSRKLFSRVKAFEGLGESGCFVSFTSMRVSSSGMTLSRQDFTESNWVMILNWNSLNWITI